MPRIGHSPVYQDKIQVVEALVASGCKSVPEIEERTGLSKSAVYRILAHRGLCLQRQHRFSNRAFILEEIHLDVPALWAAEFRGFFYGEGYADIQGESQNWRPILTINLRADDEAILRDVMRQLGGTMHYIPRVLPAHPQWRWCASGWSRVKAIVEQCGFLDPPILHSKKCPEIETVHRTILARSEMPYHPRPENQKLLQTAHDDLIRARMFKSG